MVIDVGDMGTCPKEIEDCFLKYFKNFPQVQVDEIKNNCIENESDVKRVIEKYISTLQIDTLEVYQELEKLFNQHELICYHGTRILDKNSILNNGLKVNEWQNYVNLMKDNFFQMGFDEECVNILIATLDKEYKRKYENFDKEGSGSNGKELCYFVNLSSIHHQIGPNGYALYCQNIGGELARGAFQKDYPDVYARLENNGEAYIVKFKIAFSQMTDFRRSLQIYKFLLYYAGKYFYDFEGEIDYDDYLCEDVSKDAIIQLIPYSGF